MDPAKAPGEVLADKDLVGLLLSVLDQDERRIVRMVLLEKQTLVATAAALNMSLRWVSEAKCRAVKKMRDVAANPSRARALRCAPQDQLDPTALTTGRLRERARHPNRVFGSAGLSLQRALRDQDLRQGRVPGGLLGFRSRATLAGWHVRAWKLGDSSYRLIEAASGVNLAMTFLVNRLGKLLSYPGHGLTVIYARVPNGEIMAEHLSAGTAMRVQRLGSIRTACKRFGYTH